MQKARILGHVTATVKHPSLQGWKLVVLQPLNILDEGDEFPQLALDQMGTRRGDLVFFTSDTKHIRAITGSNNCPARFSVQGIID
ncbi:MAG: EutN/CcmL family microcompartment protein [Planctomycetaceae bacterium]